MLGRYAPLTLDTEQSAIFGHGLTAIEVDHLDVIRDILKLAIERYQVGPLQVRNAPED